MTTFTTDQIATLKRNLDETSYNDGSQALACRLSDCKAYIEQLEHSAMPLLKEIVSLCHADNIDLVLCPNCHRVHHEEKSKCVS